uniref:Uncharacterized protein n=1 Tax=Arundo donax TaxID=35708 RepID=A0A0A8Z247_ARUDO
MNMHRYFTYVQLFSLLCLNKMAPPAPVSLDIPNLHSNCIHMPTLDHSQHPVGSWTLYATLQSKCSKANN